MQGDRLVDRHVLADHSTMALIEVCLKITINCKMQKIASFVSSFRKNASCLSTAVRHVSKMCHT